MTVIHKIDMEEPTLKPLMKCSGTDTKKILTIWIRTLETRRIKRLESRQDVRPMTLKLKKKYLRTLNQFKKYTTKVKVIYWSDGNKTNNNWKSQIYSGLPSNKGKEKVKICWYKKFVFKESLFLSQRLFNLFFTCQAFKF
jgi:hypothetical protein